MKNPIKSQRNLISGIMLISLFISSNLFSQTTALYEKIRDNDLDEVKALIESGADVNQVNEMDGYSPLMGACLRNNIDIVKYLISKGADLNIQEPGNNVSALILACSYSMYANVAKLLINEGADVNIVAKDGNTALIAAAGSSEEVFKLLLSKGADISAKDKEGKGVMTKAIFGVLMSKMDLEFVEFVISKGGDVNEVLSGGLTPLLFAVSNNKEELTILLIKHGANVNAKTDDGQSLLALAEKNDYESIVKLLKENGAK